MIQSLFYIAKKQEEFNNDGYNQKWSAQDQGKNEYQNNGGIGFFSSNGFNK